MNQQQRNFLIDRIKEKYKSRMSDLKKPEPPDIGLYVRNAAVAGTLQLKPADKIMATVTDMAKAGKIGHGSGFRSDNRKIELFILDLVEPTADYLEAKKEYDIKIMEYEQEVYAIRTQADTLITRIQLASNKVLDRMISEVDDMGNLSLMDTKLTLALQSHQSQSKDN